MSPSSQALALGLRLKQVREANGLSQRQLAKRAGVTNSSISMIEQGQVSPSVQLLGKVLSAIPMSLAHFFSSIDSAAGDVFYAQQNMLKHEKPYGFMQVVGENLTDRNVTLKYLWLDPQSDTGETPMSSHFDQSGWIIGGELQVTIGAQIKVLSSGEGFYLRAYTPCRLENLSSLHEAQVLIATEVSKSPRKPLML